MTTTIARPLLSLAKKRNDFWFLPDTWTEAEDVPTFEEMCEYVKSNWLFADQFFFPESNNWENWRDGTFEPLYDFQAEIIDACENNQVVWIQASRGSSKSYSIARWLVSYCLRHPSQAAKIIAPSFRQSRQLVDYCVAIIRSNSQIDALFYRLEQDVPPDNIKRGHEVIINFINGSSIEALPAGDGSTLRGKRATILVCDEFYLFPREIYVSHILPFLNVEKGEQPAKLIHLTTSYYQDVYAFSVLMDIAKYVKQGRKGYIILDIDLDDVINSSREVGDDEPEGTKKQFPAALPMILHQLETGTDKVTGQLTDETLMTFYNKWIKSSANFYRTDKVLECQHPEVPVLDKKPSTGWNDPFVGGIDLAGQGADATAFSVLSLPGDMVRKLHALYKWEKQSPEQISGHIHKMVDLYGMTKIVMDKTGVMGAQVADLCSREDQLIDDVWQKRIPITVWDHPDASKARSHLILTRPSDELMISGLYGPRVDSIIGGELALKNAFHNDMKARFENHSFIAPSSVEDKAYYDSSKGELLDNIREGLSQFPKIDRVKEADGKQPKRSADGNFYFTKPPHDDGAYAVIYGNWCANIVYKELVPKRKPDAPPIIWQALIERGQEAETHQVVHPKLF
jgi:hypothetical protein